MGILLRAVVLVFSRLVGVGVGVFVVRWVGLVRFFVPIWP